MMQSNELKGKTGIRRIIHATYYSKDGLKATYQHEPAFRQLLILNGILVILTFCFHFDAPIRMILIMASFFSLIVELLNTAIEAVVDDISLQLRPLAKRAKDAGSAAQMLAITLIAMLWILAFSV